MAHITSQTATETESQQTVQSDDLEESDSSKEGTHPSVSESVSSTMFHNSCVSEEKPEVVSVELGDCASVSLEDTSCSVKKKNRDKRSKTIRDSRSECRTIKAGADDDSAVSGVSAELVEGCATLNSADRMERVNPDVYAYGTSGSPYLSSDNEWEASDHSDTDADHSDSSDDDNPTSQVDRMIERGARLIMDGENSNLSSETDDTDDDEFDDDSDSDITDVSPLVSNAASPLGLSPVMSRKNLPSSISSKPPFMRHYSHRGHDGDVEDEVEEDQKKWTTDELYNNHDDNTQLETNSANMSLVVQALLKLSLESQQQNDSSNQHNKNLSTDNRINDNHNEELRNRHQLSPALNANPHHRHLRKTNNSRRKNMSFTNEEVRIINRDNSIILEKLLAVNSRDDKSISPSKPNATKQATSTVNRKRQEEGIRKENLVSSYAYFRLKAEKIYNCHVK